MSATRAGRNLTRSLLLVLGGSAVVAGAILTSFGLYREFVSSGDASAPSLASQHRTDPGGSMTALSAERQLALLLSPSQPRRRRRARRHTTGLSTRLV